MIMNLLKIVGCFGLAGAIAFAIGSVSPVMGIFVGLVFLSQLF